MRRELSTVPADRCASLAFRSCDLTLLVAGHYACHPEGRVFCGPKDLSLKGALEECD
jgi:hypothetical protein